MNFTSQKELIFKDCYIRLLGQSTSTTKLNGSFGDVVLAIVKVLQSNIPAMRPAHRSAWGSRGGALPDRTGLDRPPQSTTRRILPHLGCAWRAGGPRDCFAWTGGCDTSLDLVTVHRYQKMQYFVIELNFDPYPVSIKSRRPSSASSNSLWAILRSELRIFITEIQDLTSALL